MFEKLLVVNINLNNEVVESLVNADPNTNTENRTS